MGRGEGERNIWDPKDRSPNRPYDPSVEQLKELNRRHPASKEPDDEDDDSPYDG